MTHIPLRTTIDALKYAPEAETLTELIGRAALSDSDRARISARAAQLVRDIRASAKPGLMEVFLAEYGLSTDEGVALMCLAEALLRVPDADTIDALIEDKIAPSDWGRHLGHSSSSLVNASTWALMLTGRVLDDEKPGMARALRGAIKRLGEPVIRTAVARAMREMGRQFVLGETIQDAMSRAKTLQSKGYSYSYDMLGEAARTHADADRYFEAYSRAISAISGACKQDIRHNPGISVKLSALHPRYEEAQREVILRDLPPRILDLAQRAKAGNMGLSIDAEEADRLGLSLDVIEQVLSDDSLAGWDGFGIVVQAYGQRAGAVIDWLNALADHLDRRVMLRLVKGAYWDTEIKHAQVMGVEGFPVFTQKTTTDVSYIANARKLLGLTNRIYPQFATHNAHTAAAILDMAETMDIAHRDFEFQKLHGMGDRLHELVMADKGRSCRIYAPVGAHRDLLAYLVRRLLENGANSSFVNQIVDVEVAPEVVAADPFAALPGYTLPRGPDLYAPERRNSKGWDIAHLPELEAIEAARAPFAETLFYARPLIATELTSTEGAFERFDPAHPDQIVGHCQDATQADVDAALSVATRWDAPVEERARILNAVADLYEANFGKLFAMLTREAGKSLPDCVGELREAVDFLRYYAARAQINDRPARGLFTCISPWNFPLAIFTGQIAGALACGNGVLAKPAQQTPFIAHAAVILMHEAGVPLEVLQLLPGGGDIGAALTSDPRVAGVAFTGSTATAQAIRRAMAQHMNPSAPLIAETGGINAMIVDSTALPEQAVRDVVQSAFQSAGQRCSALRCLYVQEDIAKDFKKMLFGAMEALTLGSPWQLSTDVGPVIDTQARDAIQSYVDVAQAEGRLLKTMTLPEHGHFIAPSVIEVSGIADLDREIFGPVLHIATFKSDDLDKVTADIAASGYGLTFGLHTRIDDRVQHIVEHLPVGNIYVNRNQIGAIVGSQPFGGEGLSGTGPKAGGPDYLTRFSGASRLRYMQATSKRADPKDVQTRLNAAKVNAKPVDTVILPGPTGESNRLSRFSRSPFLCLGPGAEATARQVHAVTGMGGAAVAADGLPTEALTQLDGFAGAIWWGEDASARSMAQALATRDGAILPLITGGLEPCDVLLERHLCIDTTASGGNADLLAEVAGP